jgi:predicted ATPase
MLALLATVYQNRLAAPLAIEEPAKDMYSRELGLTSAVLKRARWLSQVIITTHSPDLLDGLPVESFLVLEKDEGVSKIGPLIQYQREVLQKKMFSLKELIDIDGLHREGSSLRAKV